VQAQDIAVVQDPNRGLGGFSLAEDEAAICQEKKCHKQQTFAFHVGPHKPEHSGMGVYGATYMPGEDGAKL